MRRFYIMPVMLTFFLTLASSCKEESYTDPVKDIKGQWEWIFTYRVYVLSDSNPLTPKYTGINQTLIFNKDRSWVKKENGIKIDSGLYSLGHGRYTPYQGAYVFIYDSLVFYDTSGLLLGHDYYDISGDTLCFCPGFADRYYSYSLPYNGSKYWIRKPY